MRGADDFFAYARRRYQLMLNKEAGLEWPWTDDPILQRYRFCNVFREDDKVTRWIRPRVTLERFGDRLLGAMVIARWFNRIETLERLDNLLTCWGDDMAGWAGMMREVLRNQSPLVTGAYMIKTPAKMPKLEGIIWCLERFLPDAVHIQARIEPGETTLESVTEVLAEYPYLGPFMAYEVVTDLRHTPLLDQAPDIMTWANPGPGAARGLARVLGLPLDHYDRHRKADVRAMMVGMRELLRLAGREPWWPRRWPRWEMRDVEHTLCEFDKYERARLGEGQPKQRYNGGG